MSDYIAARDFLHELFTEIVIGHAAPDKKNAGLIKNFLRIFPRLGLKNISSLTALQKAVTRLWDREIPRPAALGLRDELIMEFISENNPYLKTMTKKQLQSYGQWLLSNHYMLGELFISVNLHSAYICKRFNLKLKPPAGLKKAEKTGKTKYIFYLLLAKSSAAAAAALLFAKNIHTVIIRKLKHLSKPSKTALIFSSGIIIAAGTILTFITTRPEIIEPDRQNKKQNITAKSGTAMADKKTRQEHKAGSRERNSGQVSVTRTSPPETKRQNTEKGKNAVFLQWDIEKGTSLNLVKKGTVLLYKNGTLSETQKEYNIANFICRTKDRDRAYFTGLFKSFSFSGKNRLPSFLGQKKCRFSIKNNGTYVIPVGQELPNIRSIPSFPARKVAPGDTWQAPCELYFYDLDPPLLVQEEASYYYLSNREKAPAKTAVIRIHYSFLEKQSGKAANNSYKYIAGSNQAVLYWDIKKGKPLRMQESYDETITQKQGSTLRRLMKFNSLYDISSRLQQTRLNNIKKRIDKAIKDYRHIKTFIKKDGLHICLSSIYFNFEKFYIKEQCKLVLDRIKPLLAKYPHYEIMVQNNSRTSEGFNTASEVGNYLKNRKNKKLYINKNRAAAAADDQCRVAIIIKKIYTAE
ncbi:MAG TPA: hypothetical protein VKS21_02640 [Spirochaetota bacterium]|nr:hypothetical protein [Spirochaetota bacterium]